MQVYLCYFQVQIGKYLDQMLLTSTMQFGNQIKMLMDLLDKSVQHNLWQLFMKIGLNKDSLIKSRNKLLKDHYKKELLLQLSHGVMIEFKSILIKFYRFQEQNFYLEENLYQTILYHLVMDVKNYLINSLGTYSCFCTIRINSKT